jgi:hypothetical protein
LSSGLGFHGLQVLEISQGLEGLLGFA